MSSCVACAQGDSELTRRAAQCRFYSKGSTCCDDIRLQLNCDPVGPCREFTGDCTDIPDQFTTMLFVDPLAECQPMPSPVND